MTFLFFLYMQRVLGLTHLPSAHVEHHNNLWWRERDTKPLHMLRTLIDGSELDRIWSRLTSIITSIIKAIDLLSKLVDVEATYIILGWHIGFY
ncbi:hypothetical protein ACJX0J_005497, partial [Zea mays]